MSKRSDDLYLVDLIESAEFIERMLRGVTLDEAESDQKIRDAALWRLYVIGEAASRLSEATRKHIAGIPWELIRAFRNRMAHGYFTLEWPRVWEILTCSIPELRAEAEGILAERFPDVFRQLHERRTRGSSEEGKP